MVSAIHFRTTRLQVQSLRVPDWSRKVQGDGRKTARCFPVLDTVNHLQLISPLIMTSFILFTFLISFLIFYSCLFSVSVCIHGISLNHEAVLLKVFPIEDETTKKKQTTDRSLQSLQWAAVTTISSVITKQPTGHVTGASKSGSLLHHFSFCLRLVHRLQVNQSYRLFLLWTWLEQTIHVQRPVLVFCRCD